MINKTILPLFTTTLIIFGTQALYAVETTTDDQETGATAKSKISSSTPLLSGDDSSWLHLEHKMAKLLPKDEKDFRDLTLYASGDWDPEGPINHNGLLQLTIYKSKLEHKLSRIMTNMRQDRVLSGGSSPSILSYSLPIPKPGVVQKMPIYKEDEFKRDGIQDSMVIYCAKEYEKLMQSSPKGTALSKDEFTEHLIDQSLQQVLSLQSDGSNKDYTGWPIEKLQRISAHLVEADDLEAQVAQKDANNGDPDKK